MISFLREFFRNHPKWARLFTVIAVLAVLGRGVYWWNTRPLPGPMGEFVGPDEEVYMAQLVNAATVMATQDHDIRWNATNPHDNIFRRDVHGKTPGCVKATFTVLNDLLPVFKQGLFKVPGEHKAWIRFSNGSHLLKADTEIDVRGVALKVMGVTEEIYGPKLLDAERHAETQDISFMNSPVYFFRDLKQYAEFSHMLTWRSGWLTKRIPATGDVWPFFGYSWNPLNWNVRSLIGAGGANKKPPPSPVHSRYWSASAYAFGSQNYVKYSLIPQPCTKGQSLPDAPPIPGDKTQREDFLRANLGKVLAKGPWCYDLAVQLQMPGKRMPVEDPTIEWSEKDSPFVTVAKLQILQNGKEQSDTDDPFTTASNKWNCFCEALSFNPWHSLPEHRPVGVFNRIRKAVYQEGARFRREKNEATQAEPKDWSLSLTMKNCGASGAPVASAAPPR